MLETIANIDQITWLGFVAASVVLMVTPGPGMMFCLACGLIGGPRAGIAAGAGAAAGLLVHTALAAMGFAALLFALPGAYDVLRIAGAAYLLWLAWESWNAKGDLGARKGRRELAHAFRRGLVTNLTNPKVIFFMVAFLPQFADPATGPVWHQMLVFGTGVAAIGFVFDALYGGLAGLLANRLRRASRVLNRVSALVFGGLAARLAIN